MQIQSESRKYEGQCKFCDQDFSKRQIVNHVEICEKRKIDRTNSIQGLRLRICDTNVKNYWLIVEVNKTAKLKDLDKLIRNVWVECCEHLSLFGDYNAKVSMERIIFETLRPGDCLPYIYDFGSSTELIIETLNYSNHKLRDTKKTELVARNYPIPLKCVKCDQQVTHFCSYCLSKEETFFCNKCAKSHQVSEDCEIVEIANSPRSGVCGYEPPEPLEKLF